MHPTSGQLLGEDPDIQFFRNQVPKAAMDVAFKPYSSLVARYIGPSGIQRLENNDFAWFGMQHTRVERRSIS